MYQSMIPNGGHNVIKHNGPTQRYKKSIPVETFQTKKIGISP